MADTAFTELPSERSIRLLKLFAFEMPDIDLPEGFGPLLGFTVEAFELDNCPDFTALSYTWGNPMREHVEYREMEEGLHSTQYFDIPLISIPRDDASRVGAQPLETSVRVSERSYQVPDNLQAAFKQLYRSGLGGSWIWADALCIDQENKTEKAVQVAMMDEIYSRAGMVVVWLGEDTSNLASFLWLHEEFVIALNSYIERFGLEELGRQRPLDPRFTEKLGVVPPGGSWYACWEEYFTFLRRRRWFSRSWVVQEVSLAREVALQCGPQTISWQVVSQLGDFIAKVGWQPQLAPSVDRASGRAIADEIVRLSVVRRNLQSQYLKVADREQPPAVGDDDLRQKAMQDWLEFFQVLLSNTAVYSSSDPRDKIYSVLGMAKAALPEGFALPISPDYSEECTAVSVFTSVASLFLRSLPRLMGLSFVRDRSGHRMPGLPSWVPDYTVTQKATELVLIRSPENAFDCCPVQTPAASVVIVGNRLHLQGARFDRVAAVCTPILDILKTQVIDDLLEICEGLSAEYYALPFGNSGPGEVLWRTIVADTDTLDRAPAAPEVIGPSFKNWVCARLARCLTPDIVQRDEEGRPCLGRLDPAAIRARTAVLSRLAERETRPAAEPSCLPTADNVLAMCRLMYSYSLHGFMASCGAVMDPGDPLPTPEQQNNTVDGGSAAFVRMLTPVAPCRRVYRTEAGYLGLGPASMEVGDEVWMVEDARVPFVLRAREGEGDGGYALVGETYVHGFMDAEMKRRIGDRVGDIWLE
ncbi:hypothetical protein NKR23_g4217 [Pleurostoma richardsiae]|uniref:Heterokaryon incompatibility domain-containing protein n=1 Tax=Pleurostoma richardsiae TaxID=41990 RepID=A0AA38S511_9PEZI|nr:hypothetical protein NKR23_g4217 [Pleurostoma richardsiae]